MESAEGGKVSSKHGVNDEDLGVRSRAGSPLENSLLPSCLRRPRKAAHLCLSHRHLGFSASHSIALAFQSQASHSPLHRPIIIVIAYITHHCIVFYPLSIVLPAFGLLLFFITYCTSHVSLSAGRPVRCTTNVLHIVVHLPFLGTSHDL